MAELLNQRSENEIIEYKDRKTISDDEMGMYFSALSNEANLCNVPSAWIVFGISDKSHEYVSSNYKDSPDSINKLKHYIAQHTTNNLTFRNVHELIVESKRILMFEIPAARSGVPTSYKRIAYGRDGESRVPLSDDKRERITRHVRSDWSATIVKDATIDDLDKKAIEKARSNYKRRNKDRSAECDTWDDLTFLNKMRITNDGNITYAALILLGKEESEHKIPNVNLHMRWILRNSDNAVLDHEMFGLPFILAADELCSKIRNLNYEFFRKGTLVPDRMETYDPSTIREALNNCIAHQDYELASLITVVEYDRDRLVFNNAGSFIPGTIDAVIVGNKPTGVYRNPYLANAMSKLGMVDTMGSGIIRMFESQKKRMFPMPEYAISPSEVEVTIIGKVIDENFANTLIDNPRLSLKDVILLDKVQKRLQLSDVEIKHLKKNKLIDGRKPNFTISSNVVKNIGDEQIKGKSITDKGFKNEYYKDIILEYISKYEHASRLDIDALLTEILPGILTPEQKHSKIGSLLTALRKNGAIKNIGTTRYPKYVLVKK